MPSSQNASKKRKRFALFLIWTGISCIVFSVGLFMLIFGQVVQEEAKYDLHRISSQNKPLPTISPVNSQFGIVIPKIGANAPIIQNVDPYNEHEYQVALTKGIAHAKGTSFPERANKGTVFLFAHSAGDFYEANKYNAIFYLLNKMEKEDEIIVFYKEKKYVYHVTETKIVNEDEVSYLNTTGDNEKLVLMTCWPAGTSLKRLLVIAKPS